MKTDFEYRNVKCFVCGECKDEKCKIRVYSDVNFILTPPSFCPYGYDKAKWVNSLRRRLK